MEYVSVAGRPIVRWLDRQARTLDQRMEISVAFVSTYVVGMVAAFLQDKLISDVCFVVFAAIATAMMSSLRRDQRERRRDGRPDLRDL